MLKSHRTTILIVLTATLLSVSLGLYNNFPITYPDTAAYLASGIENTLPLDRPIFYGWFLRATHMWDNLFLSLFAQGILATAVLYLFFKSFSVARNKKIHFLLSVFFLVCFTGYSFFVSFLMPDIFTFILVISLACLFFGDLKDGWRYFLFAVCTYSIIVHNSHFYIFILCLVFLGVKFVLFNKSEERKYYLRKWLTAFSIFIGAVLISLIVNFAFTKKLFLAQNGHVFFISRMSEIGVLKDFLDHECQNGEYVLCPYKDSIPADFIWDPTSPLHKTGGFNTSAPGYKKMIREMLTRPQYLKAILVNSFFATMQQLGSFEIEPASKHILAYINEQFDAHSRTQSIAFQHRHDRLHFDQLNERQHIIVLGSFSILVILLLFSNTLQVKHRQLIVFIFWACLFNAMICASFSTVLTRYQGRVIFLIPLVLLLILPTINFKELMGRNWADRG